MTEKRFKFSGCCEVYDTTDTYNTIDCATSLDAEIVYNLLNKLSEENEQLKLQLQNTSDQRDEFHRGARENANRVGKLKKENERLQKELNAFKPVIFQDMRKGTVILYSKEEVKE